MSRVIKFRVYDKTKGYYVAIRDNDCFDIRQTARVVVELTSLGHEFILEQFTGLKDKNGKEIYDGDIVKYLSYRKECIGQVVFDFVDDSEGYYVEKHYGWGIRRDGYNLSLGDYANENMKCELVEVIGTIHENPELLEKGE